MKRPPVVLTSLLLLGTPLLACSSGDSTTGTSSGASTSSTSSTSSTTGSGGAGGAGTTTSGTGGAGGAGTGGQGPIGGERPVSVHVPPSYEAGKPAPLLLMLHGYVSTGELEEAYLQITPESDKRGFLYAHPDGTTDVAGSQFWNATDACCNVYGSTVDDSTYLSTVITQIQAKYSVDPKRIFLVGHSNGAFMSYRMACDHADQIAAIASLAGAMYQDVSKCKPSGPVSVLEIHGTADTVIPYAGGLIGLATFPSAATSVSDWATFDACSGQPDASGAPLDLDATIFGSETTVLRYKGCAASSAVELWSIQLGLHVPTLNPTFIPALLDFLYAHPKP